MTAFRSGTEFAQYVLDLKPRLAVFDCDGTLWSGDAGQDFFYWEIERGLIPRAVAGWALPRYDDYLAGKVGEEEMCGQMVTIHRGIAVEKIMAAAQEFFRERVAARIFPPMQELTMMLGERGCELWAVSSTNEWVVRAGVDRFGIPQDHVLAACVECKGGCATDRLLRVPTDEGKARAIREVIQRPIDAAFGNTVHDAAMLAMAKHGFAVAPQPALEKLAEQRGWRIFHP